HRAVLIAMSQATTRANPSGANTGQEPPPSKGLRGLLPYLRRYTWSIVFGLFMVVLMGIIGNVLPLAIGILTDTLSGSPAPFEHAGDRKSTRLNSSHVA